MKCGYEVKQLSSNKAESIKLTFNFSVIDGFKMYVIMYTLNN